MVLNSHRGTEKMSDPKKSSSEKDLARDSPRTVPENESRLNENRRRPRDPHQALYARKETQAEDSEEEKRLKANNSCDTTTANPVRSRAHNPRQCQLFPSIETY